jgi:thiamine pyrophosphate-dependent acetolactate synthase large subunit-like protein
MENSLIGTDLLVRALADLEVRDFFYLLGGPLIDATDRAVGAGLRGIDVRDERAAVFAAIAYARLTRSPGVALTCSGPGTLNAVTGMGHAMNDGAPVVLVGGATSMFSRGTGAFQETDQMGVMAPVTKWAYQVSDADGIPGAMAHGTLWPGRPRRVHGEPAAKRPARGCRHGRHLSRSICAGPGGEADHHRRQRGLVVGGERGTAEPG